MHEYDDNFRSAVYMYNVVIMLFCVVCVEYIANGAIVLIRIYTCVDLYMQSTCALGQQEHANIFEGTCTGEQIRA